MWVYVVEGVLVCVGGGECVKYLSVQFYSYDPVSGESRKETLNVNKALARRLGNRRSSFSKPIYTTCVTALHS